MNLFTSHVLIGIGFASIIQVITDDVDCPTSDNELPILQDLKKNISETNDMNALRSYVTQLIDYYKNDKDPTTAFLTFHCAAGIEIKTDLEGISPKHWGRTAVETKANERAFQSGIRRLFPIHKKIQDSIDSFRAFATSPDTADVKMPRFYDTMNAFLLGGTDPNYLQYLSPESKALARVLRAGVLAFNNLTETDKTTKIDDACERFSEFYARIRHGCNSIHRLYLTLLQSWTRNLPEELHSMGFLKAWNFSEEDLKLVNMVRKLRGKSLILAKSYNFTTESGEVVAGILPVIDTAYCPRFP